MATSTGTQKFATRLSEATEAGQKFVELFYDSFDKRRQVRARRRVLINAHHQVAHTGHKRPILGDVLSSVEWPHKVGS